MKKGEGKSLFWIISTIEANILIVAILIVPFSMFLAFLSGEFLQNQIGKILIFTATFLLSVWATKLGVTTVLKRTSVKQENVLKICFWVGFIPLLLAMGLFVLGKIVVPNFKLSGFITNFIGSIFSAVGYGFFTYFWFKKLNNKVTVSIDSVGSQVKNGLIITLILVSAIVGYALLNQKIWQSNLNNIIKNTTREDRLKAVNELISKSNTTQTPSGGFRVDPTANWKIYDSQGNFTFKYPSDWEVAQANLPGLSLIVAPSANIEDLRKVNFQVGGSKKSVITIISPFNSSNLISDNSKTVTTKNVVAGGLNAAEYTSVYKVDLPGIQKGDISINTLIENKRIIYSIGLVDVNYKETYDQILSTFKFVDINSEIASANLALPATCEDKQDGMPVIISVSGYFGSIGTKIEITGCNFSGFEGDKNAWIKNEQGIKGILYGEEGSTSKSLKVALKSPLCQKDNSSSGLPCDAWLTLNPGLYKIYTSPWGKKSNEVNFTIK